MMETPPHKACLLVYHKPICDAVAQDYIQLSLCFSTHKVNNNLISLYYARWDKSTTLCMDFIKMLNSYAVFKYLLSVSTGILSQTGKKFVSQHHFMDHALKNIDLDDLPSLLSNWNLI